MISLHNGGLTRRSFLIREAVLESLVKGQAVLVICASAHQRDDWDAWYSQIINDVTGTLTLHVGSEPQPADTPLTIHLSVQAVRINEEEGMSSPVCSLCKTPMLQGKHEWDACMMERARGLAKAASIASAEKAQSKAQRKRQSDLFGGLAVVELTFGVEGL